MKFKRQSSEEVSVNLTPLIDVVFLLLIFFMVSTTFTKETHLRIDLPKASTGAVQETPRQIDITITAAGEYSVNGKPLVNGQLETLKKAISREARNKTDMPLIITADAQSPHQNVVTAMDAAGQLGFIQLSISTRSTEEQ